MPEQRGDAQRIHWPESTYIHQLNVIGGWVGVVRPVGDVDHVVSLGPKTLPKPVMKLFPLFPVYGKGSIYFFLLLTFLISVNSLFHQHITWAVAWW